MDEVSLYYPLIRRRVTSVKKALLERLRGREASRTTIFRALKKVSFSLYPGEVLGVCGHNGSGKSSLLRLVAGIQRPSRGTIRVRGRIGTILSLAGGFHDDSTGRENISLACLLSGMGPDETREHTPEIIEFADLGDFIDNPVRTFSSGMRSRLGFAIAAHIESDVLLVDEVLSVGDEAFQARCSEWTESKLSAGVSMLLVSHDLVLLRRMCHRVVWLHHGRVRALGNADEVLDEYHELMCARPE